MGAIIPNTNPSLVAKTAVDGNAIPIIGWNVFDDSSYSYCSAVLPARLSRYAFYVWDVERAHGTSADVGEWTADENALAASLAVPE